MPASATIINVPGDQPNIQAGINNSSHGDTVLVQPDTYFENIGFIGHNITLGSLFLTTGNPSYISSTIIDGNGVNRVVTLASGETNDAKIIGFTIQNGHALDGGGISCIYASPTISNNTISGNSAVNYGGGIRCENNSNATISNNTISGNSADDGGGIYCWSSNPTISNNTISRNSADYGGGIYYRGSSPVVITNTIFWGDSAPDGPEIFLEGTSSSEITYCDVQGGWEGEGNVDCDPMFCDPENGNFYLDAASCCVGAGEGGVDIGAFGVGCGVEIPTLSEWGMLIMGLLLLALGTVAVVRRRKAAISKAA